jgi:hypothetical protein
VGTNCCEKHGDCLISVNFDDVTETNFDILLLLMLVSITPFVLIGLEFKK